MASADLVDLVDHLDITRTVVVQEEPLIELLQDTTGWWRVAHVCLTGQADSPERHQVRIAPELTPGGHQVLSEEPLHIEPSISCPSCGLHGYVRDAKWVRA